MVSGSLRRVLAHWVTRVRGRVLGRWWPRGAGGIGEASRWQRGDGGWAEGRRRLWVSGEREAVCLP
jgi:hypothetical protein